MMRGSTLFLCSVLLFFFSLTPSVLAQSASDIQNQINAHTQQIAALEAEIKQYEQQLNATTKQKDTLQSAVNSLALSQKQLAAEIKVTQAKIASANLEIQKLSSSIGDKEAAVELNQATIAKAMRSIAEQDATPLVAQLLGASSLGEAWQQADAAIQLNRALDRDVTELRAVKVELSANRDEVTAQKKKLVSLSNNLSLQERSVALQKTAQQKLLNDTKNQESNYQKIIAQKQAEEAAFEAVLFELSSKLQYALDPSHIPSVGVGILRWPLDNVFITQQFGKTVSAKRLYTSGSHDGIDFRAAVGTPVKASLSGVVMAVNYGAVANCQYGKWVLIRHANGLATLYAHLSDISVGQGESVATGQLVGFSGNTGYATGPHLHFTVYLAEAVSLKQYTCKNGRAVSIPIAPTNAYLNPTSYL